MSTFSPFPSPAQNQQDVSSALLGNLSTMQTELAGLNAQLSGLKVEADRVARQVQRENGPASSSVQVRATEVSLQMARLEGNIARLQAQIAAKQGFVSSGSEVQRGGPFNGVDPEMLTGMTFVLALAMVVPMSIAFARRFARGGARPASPGVTEIAPRLDRLEQAVDSIAIEVERISEGQRFVTKILADQPQIERPPAPGSHASASG